MPGIGMEEEQAMVPVIIGNGRAGFAVGAQVGQLVVAAESLARSVAPMPPVR